MKKAALFLGVMLLVGCVGEETIVEEETLDVKAEEMNEATVEEEFIKQAADYSRNNLLTLDELSNKMQSLDEVEDERWRVDIETILTDFYMQDIDYVLAEAKLTSEQFEKYNSTIDQYSKSSDLIDEISTGIKSANESYDTRKLGEVKKQLPVLKDELISMKDQLEFERYK